MATGIIRITSIKEDMVDLQMIGGIILIKRDVNIKTFKVTIIGIQLFTDVGSETIMTKAMIGLSMTITRKDNLVTSVLLVLLPHIKSENKSDAFPYLSINLQKIRMTERFSNQRPKIIKGTPLIYQLQKMISQEMGKIHFRKIKLKTEIKGRLHTISSTSISIKG